MDNAATKSNDDPDFEHPFFQKAGEIIRSGDRELIVKEKIPLKLLRLTPAA